MTLPEWHPVIIPSFTSIARTLREEFASRQKRLYEYIYIYRLCISYTTLKCDAEVVLPEAISHLVVVEINVYQVSYLSLDVNKIRVHTTLFSSSSQR